MIIFGTWISNYKDQDEVVFIDSECKYRLGRIQLNNEYYDSNKSIIYSDNIPIDKKDILILANINNNSFYVDNPHVLYKAVFDSLDCKRIQAECNHTWIGKSENQYCKKCKKRD